MLLLVMQDSCQPQEISKLDVGGFLLKSIPWSQRCPIDYCEETLSTSSHGPCLAFGAESTLIDLLGSGVWSSSLPPICPGQRRGAVNHRRRLSWRTSPNRDYCLRTRECERKSASTWLYEGETLYPCFLETRRCVYAVRTRTFSFYVILIEAVKPPLEESGY